MENYAFSYLEILLPTHNYVVIPEFGAFIINMEKALIQPDGKILPPKYRIVFNPEINHNDGILSSYIANKDNLSYNTANNKIKEAIKAIKTDLKEGKTINCANIGTLSTDSAGNISFCQNASYLHPDNYGLYHTAIRRIDQLEETFRKERRNHTLRYIMGGVAAASIALLLFITPSTNIKDNNSPAIQKADFISSVTSSLTEIQIPEEDIAYPKIQEDTAAKPARSYYIVIGGEDTKSKADALLGKINSSDFPQADIVEASGRYRIYVASFGDKELAETFLESFRTENPKYETAWLFSKRN